MSSAGWVSTPTGSHLRGRKSKDTEPELILRRALHAAGARFRLHRRIAKGCTPDLVLPSRQVAVFVDGDYWHGCPVHFPNRSPSGPNAALWLTKFEAVRERDAKSTALAEEAGWLVVRLWECEIREHPHGAAMRVLGGANAPKAQG
ncbi:very short patch repair endonuclease [Terrabacter sp. LjRoot27]|uniref:very short patch repair endonuclease n=1 Tax=Terrabacter sp. LjRoot27 TaxID=3342306 RepID=UPI003ECFF63A